MRSRYEVLTLADLVNTASDDVLSEELITMQLVEEGVVEEELPEVERLAIRDYQQLDTHLL
jgi:hypothetical protein|tara:strand:+ start:921 stop:1103 length:183 start_codon:yes stop_codon:yes gene_type:complete